MFVCASVRGNFETKFFEGGKNVKPRKKKLIFQKMSK